MNCRAARTWGRAIVAAIAMLPCVVITPAASATPTCIGSVQAGSTYTCTPTGSGYVQVTVPDRVTSISVVVDGGGGGKNESLGNGGSGARVSATIAVTPGSVLKVYVGAGGGAGLGGVGNVGGTGYGAGGNGGAYYGEGFGGGYGGGGGGSSALVVDGTVAVVAGGGGGGGKYYGGSAGAAAGASGGNGGGTCAVGGGGGNTSGSGGGGTSSGTGMSTAGTAGYAGKGGSGTYGAGGSSSGGGGGGGGYGGGGGGNWNGPYSCTFAGGGGAGGSYGPAGAVVGSASNAGGVATSGAGGDGQVLITFTAPAATVPGAPTDLVLSDVTTTGMTAYWTAPTDDGGATVTGYDVTVTPGTTTRVTDPTMTLTGLSTATTYTVSVKAVNIVGPSATAVSGSQATSAPGTPTAAATNLVFSGVTSSAITATWTPPSAVSGWPTLGYQVRVDGGTLTWVPDGTTSYTAEGLAPGTSHSFSVTVVNGAGSSPALTGNRSTLATVPDAPTNLVLGPATSTTITASWTAPSNTGGAAILKYTVSVDDGTAIDVTVGTTYTATGLAPSAWHTFSVRAVNTIGASAADLAGAFPTSSPPGSPRMAASSVTVGSTTTITLTGFTAFSTQTLQVTAPDGTMTSFTVTMDASGGGTGSYTAARAGSYSVVSAPAATSATFTATAPAPVVTPSPSFISLSGPKRLVDTRGGGRFGSTSTSKVSVKRVRIAGASTFDNQSTGLPSSGIGAVALNVTVVDGFDDRGYGFVTVYPCDSESTRVPNASNLNFAGGQTIPNAVIAPVSADGYVCFSVYGNTDLLVDASGYFPSGTGFSALSEPKRLVDTRGGGRFGSTSTSKVSVKRVKIAGATTTAGGATGLPSSGIAAVALNVTAVEGFDSLGFGFVTVYTCDSSADTSRRGSSSNLNFAGGQTIPNAVIAPVSADGYVCFSVYGNTDLLVDVSGYFPSGSGFSALDNLGTFRLVDTRGGGRFGSTSTSKVSVKRVKIAGAKTPGMATGLPSSGIGAVALNVTVVDGFDDRGYGFVTVYPCDSESTRVPNASNLNFAGGQTIPNAVIAPVSADGYVCFSVYGNTDLLVDASGYFS